MNTRFVVIAALLLMCLNQGCSNTEQSLPEQSSQQSSPVAEASEPAASAIAQAEVEQPAEEPAPPTEEEMVKQVRTLYAAGNFDEAETQLTLANERFPDSLVVKELHGLAAAYLRQSNHIEDAFKHLQTLTDTYLAGGSNQQDYADLFAWRLGELVQLADVKEGGPTAEDLFTDYRRRAEKLTATNPRLTEMVDFQRAMYLSRKGQLEEARQLVGTQLTKARDKLASDPTNVAAILGVADALNYRLSVESVAENGGEEDAIRTETLDFIFAQAKSYPQESSLRQRFFNEHLNAAQSLASDDPERAEATLERIEKFEAETLLPLNDEAVINDWKAEIGSGNNLEFARKRIEESRQRLALIGTPAVFPDRADGWVHADTPINSEQLQGKVVLLDFFAVWCGPCVATFPHLRTWHDEFSDDGLRVIGVSNYQSFGWDAEARRPKRIENLEPEAERKGMEQFATHHELPYPIAFMPDDELQKHYVVSGIPHVVLIDRSGKVRMYRIGSGDRNAADLEQAIKECLAQESSPTVEGG
jgi:thiol-disulfide isomerase/thioredoxin